MSTFGPLSSLQSWTGRVISGNTLVSTNPFRSTADGTAVAVSNDLKGYGLTPLRSFSDLTDRFYQGTTQIFWNTWPGSNVNTVDGETGPTGDVGNIHIPATRIRAEFTNSSVADAVVTVSLIRVKRFNNLAANPLGLAQNLFAIWQPSDVAGTDTVNPSSIYNPHTSFMRAPHFHRYNEVLFNHRVKMPHGCSKSVYIPLPSASVCMAVSNYDSTQFDDPLLSDFQSINGVTLFVVVEAVFAPSAVQVTGSAVTVANAGVINYTLRWSEHVSYSPATKGFQSTKYAAIPSVSITPTAGTVGTSLNMNEFGTANLNVTSFVPN